MLEEAWVLDLFIAGQIGQGWTERLGLRGTVHGGPKKRQFSLRDHRPCDQLERSLHLILLLASTLH